MILNLGQACSIGTTFAGGRLDLSLSEASLYANLALEQVACAFGARHGPLESIAVSSTTSGENRIALPSDFVAPLAFTLYVGSSSTNTLSRTTITVPLIQRDAAWVDSQELQGTSGQPENYAQYATWLELWPSPNSAYSLQLRYEARQPTLIDSTQTPALSAPWHQAWAYKTVEIFEAARGNPEGEALARNRYLSYVQTIPTDQANRQRDRRSMSMRYTTRPD